MTSTDLAHIEAFIGVDMQGDACIYLQLLDEDGEHINYLDEDKLRDYLRAHNIPMGGD